MSLQNLAAGEAFSSAHLPSTRLHYFPMHSGVAQSFAKFLFGRPSSRDLCLAMFASGRRARAHDPPARVPAILRPTTIGLPSMSSASTTLYWLRSSMSYVSFCTTYDTRLARRLHTLHDAASILSRVPQCPALRSGPASPLKT